MAEETKKGKHGKKNDQKMKPYLVYEYLMRYSDASHVVSANELVGYLQECDFTAEHRSLFGRVFALRRFHRPRRLRASSTRSVARM